MIDFEKIRTEALENVTANLREDGKDKLLKVILDANSRVTAQMLKAYHDQAGTQDHPPKNP